MFFFLLSIVKLVATHRDDRRRVEKALEAAGFQAGKVSFIYHIYIHIHTCTLEQCKSTPGYFVTGCHQNKESSIINYLYICTLATKTK